MRGRAQAAPQRRHRYHRLRQQALIQHRVAAAQPRQRNGGVYPLRGVRGVGGLSERAARAVAVSRRQPGGATQGGTAPLAPGGMRPPRLPMRRAAPWPRRLRPLRQDGAQRHRVRRHAAHRRGL